MCHPAAKRIFYCTSYPTTPNLQPNNPLHTPPLTLTRPRFFIPPPPYQTETFSLFLDTIAGTTTPTTPTRCTSPQMCGADVSRTGPGRGQPCRVSAESYGQKGYRKNLARDYPIGLTIG